MLAAAAAAGFDGVSVRASAVGVDSAVAAQRAFGAALERHGLRILVDDFNGTNNAKAIAKGPPVSINDAQIAVDFFQANSIAKFVFV